MQIAQQAEMNEQRRQVALMQLARKWYPLPVVACDLAAWLPGFALGAMLRMELGLETLDWLRILGVGLLGAIVTLVAGWLVGLYSNRWRPATFPEVLALSASWSVGFAPRGRSASGSR